MADDIRFGVTMFGFDKADVNTYIEKINREFENRLRDKDEEISLLKLQNKDLRKKYDEINQKTEHTIHDKNKIVDVLIKAQENAESILEEARKKSKIEKTKLDENLEKERRRISSEIEKEKAMLKFFKREVERIKKQTVVVIKNFQKDVDFIIEDKIFEDVKSEKVVAKNESNLIDVAKKSEIPKNEEGTSDIRVEVAKKISNDANNSSVESIEVEEESDNLIKKIDELSENINEIAMSYQKG